MKKTLCLFISVILAFAVMPHQTTGKDHSLTDKRKLRVLVLEGTPYDRGLQHGKAPNCTSLPEGRTKSRSMSLDSTQKFRGHVTDFKTNRYMSPISGNVSLDFKLPYE